MAAGVAQRYSATCTSESRQNLKLNGVAVKLLTTTTRTNAATMKLASPTSSGARASLRRISTATASQQTPQAAAEYMPTSPATRNAITQSTAPPTPANTARRRPASTSYQPRRNKAKSSTGNVERSDVSQKLASRSRKT